MEYVRPSGTNVPLALRVLCTSAETDLVAAPPQYLTLAQKWEHVLSSHVRQRGPEAGGGGGGAVNAAHGDPSAWHEGRGVLAC